MKKTLAVLLLIAPLLLAACSSKTNPQAASLAKCLAEKGVTMYGAYWCPHCSEQKKLFGNSWKEVPYVECAVPGGGQTEECKQAGVTAYPTWFINGEKVEGKLSLEELAKRAGCDSTLP